jgi:NADH dehydrogenase
MAEPGNRGHEAAAGVHHVPHIVILGGGFGGLAAARALRKAPVRVTLVDRSNHHLFQPLLYQVATAALSPAHIAVALRRVLRHQRNASVVMAEAVRIDTAQKRIHLTDGSLDYDFLILATGATHSYFGHAEWSQFAPGLKSLEDAIEMRRRVLLAYEAAEREPDAAKRTALLTFVVVGAGPTGVELAGALAEIARHVLLKDFRHIDPASARVVLVEAGPRVLPAFAPELSKAAERRLERMGVQVLLGRPVTAIDAAGVSMGEERIVSRCVLWAAGVQASPIAASLGVPLDRAGRAVVRPDLRIDDSVFVIGDLAAVPGVPGLAPAAIQGGRHAARSILRLLEGKPPEPFHYLDKGSLATIGRNAAVAQIGPLKLEGFIAWLMWLVVHILTLITFRNRFFVIAEWAYVYLRYERGARLITGEVQPLLGVGDRVDGPH